MAEVGILGRTIDSISRLSLIFRGSVPAAAPPCRCWIQNEHLDPSQPVYYGRVVRDAGYLICQYWFFYSFNNWRSGFGGVNEHEADWEQVTIYLDGTGATDDDGLPIPRWWCSPPMTKPATTFGGDGMTRTSAWSTAGTRWSSRAPARTRAPIWPGTTSSRCSRPAWAAW